MAQRFWKGPIFERILSQTSCPHPACSCSLRFPTNSKTRCRSAEGFSSQSLSQKQTRSTELMLGMLIRHTKPWHQPTGRNDWSIPNQPKALVNRDHSFTTKPWGGADWSYCSRSYLFYFRICCSYKDYSWWSSSREYFYFINSFQYFASEQNPFTSSS